MVSLVFQHILLGFPHVLGGAVNNVQFTFAYCTVYICSYEVQYKKTIESLLNVLSRHKVHICIPRVPQCMSPRWIWDPPTPSSASECARLPGTKGEGTLAYG
jgi:hypothetical protein